MLLIAIAFPRVDQLLGASLWPWSWTLIGLVLSSFSSGASAAFDERKHGRAVVVQGAAFVGSVAASFVIVVSFVALSIAFGAEPGRSPIEAFFRAYPLPTDGLGLVLFGAALFALVLIPYWLRKRADARQAAAAIASDRGGGPS
jgi:hypothetical protein